MYELHIKKQALEKNDVKIIVSKHIIFLYVKYIKKLLIFSKFLVTYLFRI